MAGDTTALREDYADLGVHFRGPAALDGGGIFDQCSNFGVIGYSPPNFLGFSSAQYLDGGTARGPERIQFDSLMNHVEVTVAKGSATEGSARLIAFDSSGRHLARATIILTSTLTTLAVDASGIKWVWIGSTAGAWVLDDFSAS